MPTHSTRGHLVIRIIGSPPAARAGGKMATGLEILRGCDGLTYQEFRDRCGGPRGAAARRYSPSSVMARAIATGFARLAPPGT